MLRVRVRPVYLPGEFCQDFGVSLSMAEAEIEAGRLRCFMIGDRIAVAGEDALSWREARRAEDPITARKPRPESHPGLSHPAAA
jgi:hypothetical protein